MKKLLRLATLSKRKPYLQAAMTRAKKGRRGEKWIGNLAHLRNPGLPP